MASNDGSCSSMNGSSDGISSEMTTNTTTTTTSGGSNERCSSSSGASNIVYVNDKYLPADQATISVYDRGFLFADAVYEVSAIINGRMIDNAPHLRRLHRSLSELSMSSSFTKTDEELEVIQKKLICQNGVKEGLVYLQVSRGAVIGERGFPFPLVEQPQGKEKGDRRNSTPPTLVVFTQHKTILSNPTAKRGLSVITVPDLRWKRRDLKTVGLLAQVLAKQSASDAGADDAWMIDESGHVTEAASASTFLITHDHELVTRPLGPEILAGITRGVVLDFAAQHGLSVRERLFTLEEVLVAKEAFSTSATSFVLPVVRMNGTEIGDGKPGVLTTQLREYYIERAVKAVSDEEEVN